MGQQNSDAAAIFLQAAEALERANYEEERDLAALRAADLLRYAAHIIDGFQSALTVLASLDESQHPEWTKTIQVVRDHFAKTKGA